MEKGRRLVRPAVATVVSLIVLKTAGLLVSAIVLGLGLGVTLGGKITALGRLEFRAPALFALGVVAALVSSASVPLDMQRGAYALSFWLLAIFVAANLRTPGAIVIAAGLLAQALVVTANGGAMPYLSEAATIAGATIREGNPLQIALGADSQLPFLADVIPFPFNGRAYSVGDLLIAAGIVWLLLSVTLQARSQTRRARLPPTRGEVIQQPRE